MRKLTSFEFNMHNNKVSPYLDFISVRPFKFKQNRISKSKTVSLKQRDRKADIKKQMKNNQGHSMEWKVFIHDIKEESIVRDVFHVRVEMKSITVKENVIAATNRTKKMNRAMKGNFNERTNGIFEELAAIYYGEILGCLANQEQNITLKVKSNESLRNNSSPSLHFHNQIKRNNHPNTLIRILSLKTAKMVQQLCLIIGLSPLYQQINVRNSPNDQKANVRATAIKREKHLFAGIGRYYHQERIVQSQIIIKVLNRRDSQSYQRKTYQNQVKVQKNQSTLVLKQTLHQCEG